MEFALLIYLLAISHDAFPSLHYVVNQLLAPQSAIQLHYWLFKSQIAAIVPPW